MTFLQTAASGINFEFLPPQFIHVLHKLMHFIDCLYRVLTSLTRVACVLELMLSLVASDLGESSENALALAIGFVYDSGHARVYNQNNY